MEISPDLVTMLRIGALKINATLLFTWLVMLLLTLGSWLVTRKLRFEGRIARWQNLLEALVAFIRGELAQIAPTQPRGFLPLVGTLFLFIAASNLLAVVPGFMPPTGSLSTTAALALVVFAAVPAYGVAYAGSGPYLASYLRPTFFMLPFNLIGELSRTVALAVRLFGNIMSGTMIGAILLAIAPLVFPVLMQLLGLLTGLVQAYIFSVLTAVYIAAAMEAWNQPREERS